MLLVPWNGKELNNRPLTMRSGDQMAMQLITAMTIVHKLERPTLTIEVREALEAIMASRASMTGKRLRRMMESTTTSTETREMDIKAMVVPVMIAGVTPTRLVLNKGERNGIRGPTEMSTVTLMVEREKPVRTYASGTSSLACSSPTCS